MARDDLFQIRRDSAADWTSANPTLESGEMGFETDTGKLKIGDGSTAWSSLAYTTGGGGASQIDDLSDVDTDKSKTPANGDVLTFDGTDWNAEVAPGASGGDSWSDPIDADIVPDGDGTRDAGSSSNRFAAVFTYEIDLNGTSITALENNADATDTANVTAAGALMDSEVTDLAGIKSLDTSTLQVKPSEGAFVDGDKTKLDGIESGATADQSDAEIETAYNNQVGVVSQVDAEAGTSTTPERWTPQRVAQAIAALETGGGGDSWSDPIDSDIVPDGDGTRDAGSSSNRFAAVFTYEIDLNGESITSLENGADVTDTANVTAAGALMDSEVTDLAGIKSLDTSTLQVKPTEGAFVDGDKTKLDGIESGADVTDTANVTSAGALMDSEVTNLAQVKAFDSADYATAAQGALADAAQQPPTEGAFQDGDKTKLDGIESGAEVNDVDSVNAQTGAVVLDADDIDDSATTHKFATAAELSKLSGIEASADVTDEANVTSALDNATLTDVGTPAAGDLILLQDASDTNALKVAQFSEFGGAGGGFTPAIFYAQGVSTNNLNTSMGTIDWDTAAIADTGYSEASGEITIGSELDGKVARIDWQVTGDSATNRVEIRSNLDVDPDGVSGYSTVAFTACYTARNSTQNTGGVNGFHYLTLATGMKIRVQALRDGSNCYMILNGTMIAIETKE